MLARCRARRPVLPRCGKRRCDVADWNTGRGASMRRLSGMDTAFLYLETPTTHMHVQAVMILDPSTVPGGYSFEKIKAHLASRLPRAARVPAPARVRSVRSASTGVVRRPALRLRLPRPPHRGAARREPCEQVADIVGDIAGRPLDRARPLWEFWVIEGVEHGAVVVVARMHHATIDGVSGSSLLTTILDLEPKPADDRRRPSTSGSPSTSRRISSSSARDPLAVAPTVRARSRAGVAEPRARCDRHHPGAPRLEPAVGGHAVQHAAHAVERAA